MAGGEWAVLNGTLALFCRLEVKMMECLFFGVRHVGVILLFALLGNFELAKQLKKK